jgi:hypothetical protein
MTTWDEVWVFFNGRTPQRYANTDPDRHLREKAWRIVLDTDNVRILEWHGESPAQNAGVVVKYIVYARSDTT